MKKLFYICMACLAVFAFASCGPEGQEDNTPVSGHPEQDVAGVYTGIWTMVYQGETTFAEGDVTLTADTTYVISIKVDGISSINLPEMTTLANVVQDSYYGTKIYNPSSTNGFEAALRGATYLNDEGQTALTMVFTKEVRVGRQKYKYNYSYEGVINK